MGVIIIVGIVVILLVVGFIAPFLLAEYILRGIGITMLSKKLGISGGYLGWIPYINQWQVGKMADVLVERSNPENKNSRWCIWNLLGSLSVLIPIPVTQVLILLALALNIVCYYKIFREIAHGKEILFTILSALPFAGGIIMILVSKSTKYPIASPEYASYLSQNEREADVAEDV
ncbi:MAG: hypothetical protein J6M12_03180 [Clostridia bacterium]|nr:hypothetical protein [Clostridia bacterium]